MLEIGSPYIKKEFAMNKILCSIAITIFALCGNSTAFAEIYNYNSTITLCTGACASFASMDVGSTINGTFQLDTSAGGSFDDADFGDFSLTIFNPSLPPSGPIGDPATDNPFVLDSSLGNIASNGTAGTTDAANQLNGGQMLLEFLTLPFSTNETFFVFDLTTHDGQVCIFYLIAGCIPGATQSFRFEGVFNFIDLDGDLFGDDVDNCIFTPNADQRDTDNDGYGNACDADLNNDCVVNFIDLGLFKTVMFTSDDDADFNNDAIVDDLDLTILRPKFFDSPANQAFGGICNVSSQMSSLGASAANVKLVPTSPVVNVLNGDIVTFDIVIDFSDGPLGGAFDLTYIPADFQLVDIVINPAAGEPDFSDIQFVSQITGVFTSWAVGAFDTLPDVLVIGGLGFEVKPTMGIDTTITTSPTNGRGGPWVSGTDFLTIINPSYNHLVITRTAGVGSVCGDSLLYTGETCDDGNANAGDGCSATCTIEAGYDCTLPVPGIPPMPSMCTSIVDTDGDGDPDVTDPDDDDDGIGDALDTDPLNASNKCTGGDGDNATLGELVVTDLTCAAQVSIDVQGATQVVGPPAHLRLIAPIIGIQSGFSSGRLTVIPSDPCPGCSP